MLNETRDGEMRNIKLKTTFAWELMGAKKNSRSEQKQSTAEHGKMFSTKRKCVRLEKCYEVRVSVRLHPLISMRGRFVLSIIPIFR